MKGRRTFGTSKHRKARIEKFKAKHPGTLKVPRSAGGRPEHIKKKPIRNEPEVANDGS